MSQTTPTILVAPDSFKDGLSAGQVARHLARGLHASGVPLKTIERPMADGGEGTLEVLRTAGALLHEAQARNPLGQVVAVAWASRGEIAFIEIAQAVGPALLPVIDNTTVMDTGTEGVGDLIRTVLDKGHTDIVLTTGGSCTSDGGVGMLRALGATILDHAGAATARGGGGLAAIDRADLGTLDQRLDRATLTIACDVTSPLLGPHGAAAVFGPQKGATPSQVNLLERALNHWVDVLADSNVRKTRVRELATTPGAGASGGLAFGALLLPNASMVRGSEFMLDLLEVDLLLDQADLVIVGEGKLDHQTHLGKLPGLLAARARERGVRVVAVAGQVALDRKECRALGIERCWSLTDMAGAAPAAITQAAALLEQGGAAVAQWWRDTDTAQQTGGLTDV